MYIPKNHERMRTISEIVQEDMAKHEATGGTYYDEAAEQIAGYAIQTCMPSLAAMRQSQIVLEAGKTFLIEGRRSTAYDGVHVQAEFARVALQPLVEIIHDTDDSDDDPEESLFTTFTTYDLFAVMKPVYTDPDPQDIVSGDEVFVPFSKMLLFEQVG